ncbi:site-specific integrase [Spirillospora sp. NPDC047418]
MRPRDECGAGRRSRRDARPGALARRPAPTPHTPGDQARDRAAARAPPLLDLDAGTVRVDETTYELGPLVKGTPKSEACRRTVALPDLIIPDLRKHLDEYAQPSPKGFMFIGIRGGQLRRSNLSKKAELEFGAIHVHDLRHTGNTYAAESGASLAELMNRMGHSSTRTTQVYLHARQDRGQQMASSLGKIAKRNLKKSNKDKKRRKPKGSGT